VSVLYLLRRLFYSKKPWLNMVVGYGGATTAEVRTHPSTKWPTTRPTPEMSVADLQPLPRSRLVNKLFERAQGLPMFSLFETRRQSRLATPPHHLLRRCVRRFLIFSVFCLQIEHNRSDPYAGSLGGRQCHLAGGARTSRELSAASRAPAIWLFK
jgi:hypothetical protein